MNGLALQPPFSKSSIPHTTFLLIHYLVRVPLFTFSQVRATPVSSAKFSFTG